jgi:hypothetical protein
MLDTVFKCDFLVRVNLTLHYRNSALSYISILYNLVELFLGNVLLFPDIVELFSGNISLFLILLCCFFLLFAT